MKFYENWTSSRVERADSNGQSPIRKFQLERLLHCSRLAVVDCGSPEETAHGQVGLPSNATYFGSYAQYTCDTNYKLEGFERRMCLENGSWSASPPTCKGKSFRLQSFKRKFQPLILCKFYQIIDHSIALELFYLKSFETNAIRSRVWPQFRVNEVRESFHAQFSGFCGRTFSPINLDPKDFQ